MGKITKGYLAAIKADLASGIATEHTYRPALKSLLEGLGDGRIVATNEPKRIDVGAPDFDVSVKTDHGLLRLGHVEAKDVGVSLDEFEKTEQFARYAGLHNLVVTDYLTFRWYIDGELRYGAVLGQRSAKGVTPASGGDEAVQELLAGFIATAPESISSPRVLALRMARLAHLVRDIVITSFQLGRQSGMVSNLREAFSSVLLPDLSVSDFADMYAQTLAYGLFAARANHSGSSRFAREQADHEIPKANPFLRRLFSELTGPDFDDEPYAPFVDVIAQLLADADLEAIFADFGREAARDDPVVHFYETFLTAYDPEVRELRGVYYTPLPVVSYMVRSVNEVLRDSFKLGDGFSDEALTKGEDGAESARVLVLDPAVGTGTFLYSIIDFIREKFREQDKAGLWAAYVREQLLKRLYGFELLVAPYAVAHLKLEMQLAGLDLPPEERSTWGVDLDAGERLGVYLTNSLEKAVEQSDLLFGEFISDEANAAVEIKTGKPILIVIGNPPYSGHSANKGEWIADLVGDYKRDVPGLDKPAQAKWLQDDYVKFIRFGQWRIDSTGEGILAFITNHGYLTNPTFRGMRQRLMESFSDLYLLDLHGSVKRKEAAPGGGVDENVFDIQQGVAIGIFVKRPEANGQARVFHGDLFGTRKTKYEWLESADLRSTEWTELSPQGPLYLFVPVDDAIQAEYDSGWSLAEIFSPYGDPAPGVVTTQDEFAISWSAEEMSQKVERFLQTNNEDEARELWRLCKQKQWNYEVAKEKLASGTWKDELRRILYRPFDVRWTVHDKNVAVHLRARATSHILAGDNLVLVSTRAVEIARGFEHVFATRDIAQHHAVSTKEVNYLFPLFLYPSEQAQGVLLADTPERTFNLNSLFVQEVESATGLSFSGELGNLSATVGARDIFHYIYAVLHSPGYRARYAEPLRSGFPRVPLTSDVELFRELVERGRILVELHLLESQLLNKGAPGYPVPGSNVVEKGHPRYIPPGEEIASGDKAGTSKGRVYVSSNAPSSGKVGQFIEPVEPEVWDFHIGGSRIAEKWLADRRGQTLSAADLMHYQRVIVAIRRTVAVMAEIDDLIPDWPIS